MWPRVRVLVEGSAFSQAEIAARTGIGPSTVDRWMRRHGVALPARIGRGLGLFLDGNAQITRWLSGTIKVPV
jgi:transposase